MDERVRELLDRVRGTALTVSEAAGTTARYAAKCAGPAIAGTPAQGQRVGRSAAPDSKSMSGSVPLRCLLTFVDKGIVKPQCPRSVTAAKKFQ